MMAEKVNNSKKFSWSKKRLKVAKALSEGILSQKDIAEQFTISEKTLSVWKRHPEFLAKIDEFTLQHELATQAGLLREAYRGLEIKRQKIDKDRTTHLDYVKEIADLQGMKKQKIEHSGHITHEHEFDKIIADKPELRDKLNDILEDIAHHSGRVRIPDKRGKVEAS